MIARCVNCGDLFKRRADEEWKMRCIPCWLASRPAEKRLASHVESEIAEHLRALIQLSPPDKHNGSTLAVETTQWLLRIKQELRA